MWMPVRVQDGWTGENGEFRCGMYMVKEIMQV